MNDVEKRTIDDCARQAIGEMIDSIPMPDRIPSPEFKLRRTRHSPFSAFPLVAAALALFVFIPAVLGNNGGGLTQFAESAHHNGSIDRAGAQALSIITLAAAGERN